MSTRWFLFLTALVCMSVVVGCGRKQPKPYPPNVELFKTTLYADQKIADLIKSVDQSDAASDKNPWPLFADSVQKSQSGQAEEAKSDLKKVLAIPGLESRVRIWAWNGLRELGEQPDASESEKAQGVVLEVPVEDGIDTVAAYADGSARYINFSGAVIVSDAPDKKLAELAKNVVVSAEQLLAGAKVQSERKPLTSGQARVTILSLGGNRVVETTAERVDPSLRGAALELMMEMMQSAAPAGK